MAIGIFPYIIVGASRLVNGTHITHVTAAIDVALNSAATDSELGVPSHTSGFCKRFKAATTAKGVTINGATLNLHISTAINKATFAAAEDGTLDGASADGHIGCGRDGQGFNKLKVSTPTTKMLPCVITNHTFGLMLINVIRFTCIFRNRIKLFFG